MMKMMLVLVFAQVMTSRERCPDERRLGKQLRRAPSGGPFRSTRPEFDPAKDFIQTTAGGLDKRLVSAVWVVNNFHLPFLARGCQQQQLGNQPQSIHNTSAQQSHVKNGILYLATAGGTQPKMTFSFVCAFEHSTCSPAVMFPLLFLVHHNPC